MKVSFEVLGLPAPQGNKTPMMIGGKPRMIEGRRTTSRVRFHSWRDSVTATARDIATDCEDAPLRGPLRIDITFRMPRPASRPKRHHGWHVVAPDKDKLLRSVLDGLQIGGLIVNDSQFCAGEWEALEVEGWTGAEITISQLITEDVA